MVMQSKSVQITVELHGHEFVPIKSELTSPDNRVPADLHGPSHFAPVMYKM